MSIPVANLDDLQFQDIVDEAKRRITNYAPGWTNHNVSDPGVAFVELFAWMTELLAYRLDQVPDGFYLRTLELMGVRPFRARAARADLTFWLADDHPQVVDVPAGTRVATAGRDDEAIVFSTVADLTVRQQPLVDALVVRDDDAPVSAWSDLQSDEVTVALGVGDELYLGFQGSVAGCVVALRVELDSATPSAAAPEPQPRWAAWDGTEWADAVLQQDQTQALQVSGEIRLVVPTPHAPLSIGGGPERYWLRLGSAPARLRGIRASIAGASIAAEQSELAEGEVVGTSTGRAGQVVRLRHAPLLDPHEDDPPFEVGVQDGSGPWREVAHFQQTGPHDRHVVVDRNAGTLTFGPEIRSPDGAVRRSGAIPAAGARLVAGAYRHGGGTRGNVGAHTLTQLLSTVPFVERVANLAPASGGVDAESVDNARRRAPFVVRSGHRAVTCSDYERLALEADPTIARARCLAPSDPSEPVRLLLVPHVAEARDELGLADLVLSDHQLDQVAAHIGSRRLLGTQVVLGRPTYQGVSVAGLVIAGRGEQAEVVERRAAGAIARFISPVNGGPNAQGWPFETDLNVALIVELLEAVPGVERVEEVLLFDYDLDEGRREPQLAKELAVLGENSLFMSAQPRVVVR